MPSNSQPRELSERDASEPARIRRSMSKWEKMNEPAQLLGRGLGKRELCQRVARDVGASLARVLEALKPAAA